MSLVSTVTIPTTPAAATTQAIPAIDWQIDTLDLDAYLRRVGLPAEPPSAQALSALHEAHVRTIPFENIDVILGRTPSLELADIAAKLVHRQRGGYCFEHGLLFAAVLERLGYEVRRCVARVGFAKPDAPATHLMLLTRVGGDRFLVDVGFGSGLLTPLPLTDGASTDHGGWPFRLRRDDRFWLLEKPVDGAWRVEHGFDETPQRPIDYVVGNHFVATHSRSPFTRRLVVQRKDRGHVRKLTGRGYQVEYADGRPTEARTVTADELEDVLRSLDIVVDGDDLARLRQVYAGEE
ncbi:arylamine N-acetyltransferase [Saccharomonospora xinjiangensis]|uniref:arylamine N-acetyltransferase family protein n=1 Tax=Saccharomonospora xinjiangensis TaxID=75294 RepID=UPI00106FD3D0|nr:arylamine N-acetyltransferase [Saccharomonospora xinjiangensis]QBQ60521.1 Arylamine N-acetyltransferase [Saccharomonospora xinjiangensis]